MLGVRLKGKMYCWGLWGECGADGKRGEDSFFPTSSCEKVSAVYTHCAGDCHGFDLGLGTPPHCSDEICSTLARFSGWWCGLGPWFQLLLMAGS